MNTEAPEPRVRIVVALNACRHDLGSLELAAALAARRGGELQAVFVEELNLLHVAELPFTKEVDRIFGTERAFDTLRISRAQRISLSHIRQELTRLNEQLQLHGSVTTRRGHFVKTALACVGDVDVLVIGRRRDHVSPTGGGRPAASSGRGTAAPPGGGPQPVWAVFDGSAGAFAALLAAADIASSERRPLFVAVPQTPRGLADELQRHLATAREHASVASRVVELDPFNPANLIKRVRQSGCRILVVARTASELVEAATEAAEWPLVLI